MTSTLSLSLERQSRVHYPNTGTGQPIVAQYEYDASGVLTGLDEVGSGTPRSLWRVNDVFQGHLVQSETLGNGSAATHTTYGYNAARRWLEHVETTLGAEKIQTLDYTHYANGLVHTLNAKDSAPREYQYDQLNRLAYEITSVTPFQSSATPYTYDEIGNLVGRGSTTNTYRPTQPHLIDRVGSNAYEYDANGNVATRTGPNIPGELQAFYYTPFDLPRVIETRNSNQLLDTVSFEYSADEERLVRRDSVDGTARHFVADLYQRKVDNAGTTQEERFRLYAGDRQIAEIARKDNTDQTLYFHPDHLGSPETISDDNGAAYHQHFDPFGAPIDPPSPALTRVGFTGHDHDSDLGLIDMKGRVYDPLAGRFMTADPVTQAPFWSQGLNRYSYVFNNPINNTDPSGFSASSEDWSGGGATAWGGAATGLAALSGVGVSAVGAGLGGFGLNLATSIGTGYYSRFDGSVGSTHEGVAPTTAPKGTGFNQHGGAGATLQIGPVGTRGIATPVDEVVRILGGDIACLLGECRSLLDTTLAAARLLGPDEIRVLNIILNQTWMMQPPSAEDMSKAGRALDPHDKGGSYTRAGRALQKHQSGPNARAGSKKFPAVKGPISAWNEAGQKELDDIVHHPGSTVKPLGRGGWEVYAPDGRGARFERDGTLGGFVER